MGSTIKLIWDSAMKSDKNNSFILGKSDGNSFNIKSTLINVIFKEDKETIKVDSSKNN